MVQDHRRELRLRMGVALFGGLAKPCRCFDQRVWCAAFQTDRSDGALRQGVAGLRRRRQVAGGRFDVFVKSQAILVLQAKPGLGVDLACGGGLLVELAGPEMIGFDR